MSSKLCQQCGTRFFMEPHEQWKKICLNCWKKNKKEAEAETFANSFFKSPKDYRDGLRTIPKDMMQRLIFLCHPDKHNNSQASNLATEWLLKQRDSL
jgi:DNA-directed RNA polymerase subunit RPC12/RpoP